MAKGGVSLQIFLGKFPQETFLKIGPKPYLHLQGFLLCAARLCQPYPADELDSRDGKAKGMNGFGPTGIK